MHTFVQMTWSIGTSLSSCTWSCVHSSPKSPPLGQTILRPTRFNRCVGPFPSTRCILATIMSTLPFCATTWQRRCFSFAMATRLMWKKVWGCFKLHFKCSRIIIPQLGQQKTTRWIGRHAWRTCASACNRRHSMR
ncbi:hypothetical protein DYB31_009367 [Aphanomyces astaci]|uniref:Uncharacterized protein n=2 Tax=Aphanomyces astaci TaxID=112090 RepID=A0A397FE31_APHAT|nr:hypothetical protein DYB31_009367 [Aphanomyces astaci]